MTERVLSRLLESSPDWVAQIRGEDPIKIQVVERGKCAAVFGKVIVPQDLADQREDILAFGIAYALGINLFRQLMDKSSEVFKDLDSFYEKAERLPTPIGIGVGMAVGAVITPLSMFRTGREVGEIEAQAIENAIEWIHNAGFDPQAGGDYFELGFGLVSDEKPPVSARVKAVGKVLNIALKPVTLAMDATREGRAAFKSNAERIAFARSVAR
jgi:hypothetical protein